MRALVLLTGSVVALCLAGCPPSPGSVPRSDADAGADGGAPATFSLPLALVRDVPLPGTSSRFDYQDVDADKGRLLVAHMNDDEVLVLALADGSAVARFPGVSTPRGVVVASSIGRYFASALPNQVVAFDSTSLAEVARYTTGRSPDGVGFDPAHDVLAVSAQRDGAMTLLPDAGAGRAQTVPLGVETGNVTYDAARGRFWISVVRSSPPDQLAAVDPLTGAVLERIDLPGCTGAHGLRLHPDGQSAYVACEVNDVVARVELGTRAVATAASGAGPDVMSFDVGLGLLYVAAESGDLVVYDTRAPGLTVLDREHVFGAAHSVAVDPATHRVFFPLQAGPSGDPVLRIMTPRAQ